MNKEIKITNQIITQYKKTKSRESIQELYNKYRGFLMQYVLYLKFNYYPSAKNYNIQVLNKITNYMRPEKIFLHWDKEELFNELFIRLLKFIDEYNGNNNVQYIYNCFRYEIKKWILELTKDACYHTEDFIEYIENEKELRDNGNFAKICFDKTNGLKPDESYIMYLYYNCNCNIEKIAAIMCTYPNNISTIKKSAEKKLSNILI